MFNKFFIIFIIALTMLFNFSCKDKSNSKKPENKTSSITENKENIPDKEEGKSVPGNQSSGNNTEIQLSDEGSLEVEIDNGKTIVKDKKGNKFEVTADENKAVMKTGDGGQVEIINSGNSKIIKGDNGNQVKMTETGNVKEFTDDKGNKVIVTDTGVIVEPAE